MRNAVLVSAVRTPVGKRGGVFKSLKRMDLAAPVMKEALRRASTEPYEVEELIFGNEPEARTPARFAWLSAGFPVEVAGLSINRASATGLTGLCLAASFIRSGFGDIYMCGGVEMDSSPSYLVRSTAPYNAGGIVISPKLSTPEKFGNPGIITTAENIAKKLGITREECDEFAVRSHALALKGYDEGLYAEHILPIEVKQEEYSTAVIDRDEMLRPDTNLQTLSKLKPILPDGLVTAGNSSPFNDGAAAAIMMDEDVAKERGLKPLMRLVDFAVTGIDPRFMGLGPVRAVEKVLERNKMSANDLDFIEINESFAAQTLGVQRSLGIDMDKVNIRGGGIALGHPYTATGISLAAKSAGIMKCRNSERCAIAMCANGGQGVAAIFENCD